MLQTQKYLGKDNILPSGRGGASSVFYNDKIFIFGGHFLLEEGKYQYLNDVWAFDTRSEFTWIRIKCRGDVIPPERYGHSAHVFDSKMILFGGKGSDGENLNDVWYLDLNKFIWTLITPPVTSSRKPCGRSAHASALIRVTNNDKTSYAYKLIIHGGWNGEETFSDAWVFDTTSFSWSRVNYNNNNNKSSTSTSSTIPVARYGHSLTQINSNSLLLFGGCILPSADDVTTTSTNNSAAAFIPIYSNEMKILEFDFSPTTATTTESSNCNNSNNNNSSSTTMMAWNRCRSLGRSPTGRYGHSASLLGNITRPMLVVVGGWGKYGVQTIETVNDVMAHSIGVFDIVQQEWSGIECNTNQYNLYKPSFYHSTAATVVKSTIPTISVEKSEGNDINNSSNELFVYGGYDGSQALKYILQLQFQF